MCVKIPATSFLSQGCQSSGICPILASVMISSPCYHSITKLMAKYTKFPLFNVQYLLGDTFIEIHLVLHLSPLLTGQSNNSDRADFVFKDK